jgi:DNA-binding transcriptional regulator YdaS (Cro superfamily)
MQNLTKSRGLTKYLTWAYAGTMTPQQVVKHYGSQSAAARALGLNRATICTWVTRKRIPETRQAWIQLLTGGKLVASNGK